MPCQPNLFVIGAMKAGTTFLYSVLNSHPDICMSPIKEPHYFASDLWEVSSHIAAGTESRINKALSHDGGIHNALVKDFSLYQKLFSKCLGSVYCGEASPTYLRSRVAAKGIFSLAPDARIILLLRDPIERAWSHYVMELNEARVPDSFERLIEQELAMARRGILPQHGILESGLYYLGISRYLELFPRESILIMDQSELFNNSAQLAGRLGAFLGVDDTLFILEQNPANVSVSPRYPRLNQYMARTGIKEMVRKLMPSSVIGMVKRVYYRKPGFSVAPDTYDATYLKLMEFYTEDVRGLAKLLGDDSPPWAVKYL